MNKYLGLLRWSMNYQDGTTDAQDVQPMTEERRKWLMEAIESQVVDPVEQMKNVINILKLNPLFERKEEKQDSEKNKEFKNMLTFFEKQGEVLEQLMEYIDNYDLANDFDKLGGVEMLMKLLAHEVPESTKEEDKQGEVSEQDLVTIKDSHEGSRVKSLEIIGILVQNHPKLQKSVHQKGGLEVLLKIMSGGAGELANVDDSNAAEKCSSCVSIKVKVKAVMAVGSLVRGNAELTREFLVIHKALPLLFEMVRSSHGGSAAGTEPAGDDGTPTVLSAEEVRLARKALFLVKYFVDTVESIRIPMRENFLKTLLMVSERSQDVDTKELSQQIVELIS